jgi:large subunit ribosomal protein L25
MLTKVSATPRSDRGKNANRRLRADGKIPAVAYGLGESGLALAVSPADVKKALYSEHGVNTVVKVELEGGASFDAMIAEYQYHPVSRELLHADFIRVSETKPVEVEVPLELVGKAKGIVMGGKLTQVFRTLPVRCLPSQIPVKLVHDITNLDLDQAVHAQDLALPEGAAILLPGKQTVASIMQDRKSKTEGEEEEAKK